MHKIQIASIVCLVVVTVWQGGCGGGTSSTSQHQEALDKGWELFSATWTKCTDSTHVASKIGRATTGMGIVKPLVPVEHVQMKDVRIELSDPSQPLSEADRLNGVEWRGTLQLNYSAMRRNYIEPTMAGEHGWTNWISQDKQRWHLELVKKDGNWISPKPRNEGSFNNPINYPLDGERWKQVSCETVLEFE